MMAYHMMHVNHDTTKTVHDLEEEAKNLEEKIEQLRAGNMALRTELLGLSRKVGMPRGRQRRYVIKQMFRKF